MEHEDFPQPQKIIYLISHFIDGSIDFAELQELESWRKERKENEVLFQDLIDVAKQSEAIEKMQGYDTKGSLEKIKHLIKSEKENNKVKAIYWIKLLVSAAIITLLASIFLFFYSRHQKKIAPENASLKPHPQYIAPGSDKAILTLSNGKQILINKNSHGIIATQAGMQIKNTSDGKIIYS